MKTRLKLETLNNSLEDEELEFERENESSLLIFEEDGETRVSLFIVVVFLDKTLKYPYSSNYQNTFDD